ncbi:hypothetical protein LTR84_006049 [Exophiala bonariae]|uniref:U6 small nuclear RNA (adenine-(43)-N(6))-methyltransferase n=1 Tax=Exophiala bonariae TaxID=1690606 RepID=A0AAV9N4X3_9EURO|nr:hypothetical protein LTR84_006049 [Exophiala bonariae]
MQVPNRLNYVLFIQRLIDTTAPDYRHGGDSDRRVIGIDIGTGSSCIYPLLSCRQRANWLFLATEIDDKNRSFALNNISANDLQSRIRLIDTDQEGKTLIPSSELERFDRIDFLMTNPPFYESAASMALSAKQKSRPPNSSCTGAPVEMITPGGEVAFVSRLVHESTAPNMKSRIQWFSSMLGKLSSIASIVEKLKEQGCTNYAVSEFIQGQKTRRWCVAWSWMNLRPSLAVARGISGVSGVEKKFLPVSTEFDLELQGDADEIAAKINEEVGNLDLRWRFQQSQRVGMLLSQAGDVWSRKARRKKQIQHVKQHKNEDEDLEMKDHDDDEDDEDDEEEPGLVAKISVFKNARKDVNEIKIQIRWLQGREAVAFESFCGWLKRKLEVRG